jgi:anti-sigma regulatory factor (Ser/Thr protein kinase)
VRKVTSGLRWLRRERGVALRLPADVEAPAAARRALADGGLPADVLEDAQLLVSELVTNSVLHGRLHPGQRIGVRARPRPGGVRLEVCDPGPGFPAPPPLPSSTDRFGGRGLPIVDRLADRWGAGRTRRGRWEIWAEIDRPSRRSR